MQKANISYLQKSLNIVLFTPFFIFVIDPFIDGHLLFIVIYD